MDLLGTDSAVPSPFCQVCAELLALAQGALRVLNGEEQAMNY